jgi:hypothetical protein
MPIHSIVAQGHLGNIEVTRQSALDVPVVGLEADAKLAQRDVEATTVEADVEDSTLVQ